MDLEYDAGFFRARRAVWRALRSDAPTCMVWLELEDRARYSEPGPMLGGGGRVVDLAIGEAVLGRRELAEALGLGVQQVRTAIKKLTRLHLITTRESTHLGTIVTIVGYSGIGNGSSRGQPARQPTNQPAANPQPTTNKTERHPDLDFSADTDPDQRPSDDLGSARLGPKSASGSPLEVVEQYERLRSEGGWGSTARPAMPGLRLLNGGGES